MFIAILRDMLVMAGWIGVAAMVGSGLGAGVAWMAGWL